MKLETGIVTEEQKIDVEIAKTVKLLKSNLKSLDGTGIAPKGELTCIVGPKGNGKSAFIKTILYQASLQKVKTFTILSEEKTYIYKQPVSEIIEKAFGAEKAKNFLGNLFFSSMLDWDENSKNLNVFILKLEKLLIENNFELVILDNLTTSFLGRLPVNEQGRAAEKIRSLANRLNISIIVVVHTIKGINPYQTILTGDDVRGNSTIVNISAYCYVLTTFFRCNPPRAFLYIDKARHSTEFNQTYWELKFEKDLGVYTEDCKVSAAFLDAVMGSIRKESGQITPASQIWEKPKRGNIYE